MSRKAAIKNFVIIIKSITFHLKFSTYKINLQAIFIKKDKEKVLANKHQIKKLWMQECSCNVAFLNDRQDIEHFIYADY